MGNCAEAHTAILHAACSGEQVYNLCVSVDRGKCGAEDSLQGMTWARAKIPMADSDIQRPGLRCGPTPGAQ